MNAVKLYRGLKDRGVLLEANGCNLKVDAPVGVLTAEDRAALSGCKPILLAFLSRPAEPKPRKSEALWAGPGWIRILDPDAEEWHEVRAAECLPGVIAEADAHRKRGKDERQVWAGPEAFAYDGERLFAYSRGGAPPRGGA